MQARVLVVESDPTIRKLLAAFLGSRGYPCHGVESISAALDALRRESCSLIILDLDLTERGDAVAELRSACPAVRLIGLDSLAEQRIGNPAQARLDAVIPKPFLADPLLAAMGHLATPLR
jgi:DNA-binding response OmpR family regulator